MKFKIAFPTFVIQEIIMFYRTILPFIIAISFCLLGYGQVVLPRDPSSGKIFYASNKSVDQKSKKKIMRSINEWSSKKTDFPSMVFSVISSSKDTLMLKAVSEVPSLKGLHPISFRLILVPKKRSFWFSASEFYFEDIKLSLDTWLEKYSESTSKRHLRNVKIVSGGIDSHIYLSMKQLAELIDNK